MLSNNQTILRNCGQVQGKFDALGPFLFIAKYSAYVQEMESRRTDTHPGLFVVSEQCRNAELGSPKAGLILPVNLCRNERMRAALLDMPALLTSPHTKGVAAKRREAQALLNSAFHGRTTISHKAYMDHFLVLQSAPALFELLHKHFDYVTEIVDNPAGQAQVSKSANFPWCKEADLMAWYHRDSPRDDYLHPWDRFVPFYVFGGTCVLKSFWQNQRTLASLNVPNDDLPKWFVIRPDLPNAEINIRLEMEQYGWALLHVSLGAETVTTCLSDVYDPFDDLLAWGQKIALNDVPIEMAINDEHQETLLTVLCTDDPERVLLRLRKKYGSAILLQGVVSRSALTCALRNELARFFSTEFDPEHWGDRCLPDEDEQEDAEASMPARVAAHPFMLNALPHS